jgi:hypothetical protein
VLGQYDLIERALIRALGTLEVKPEGAVNVADSHRSIWVGEEFSSFW